MRKHACFLLLLGGMPALQAAETWRWRDANGVIHFSDVPVPGAERINIGPAPRPGSVATAPRSPTTGQQGGNQVVPYQRCVLVAPSNDQVALNEDSMQVTFDLQPGLQGGHQVQVLLNGSPVADWDPGTTQSTLTSLERGSYTLVARVLDDFGRPLCTSPTVNFHIRLPTVPNRQPIRPQPRPAGG